MLPTWRVYTTSRVVFPAVLLLLSGTLLWLGEFKLLQPKATREAATNSCGDDINWSRFAYVQYAITTPYLCSSVMVFESLQRFGSKADRLLMYPSSDMNPNGHAADGKSSGNIYDEYDSKLLRKARDKYGARLQPVKVQRKTLSDKTWAESFTKLLAFNQTQYDRVLYLDSDATLQAHMDELFFLPSTPVAMPRSYWESPPRLGSHLMLIQPSAHEFGRIERAIQSSKAGADMEIINQIYRDTAMVLPHATYGLLTRTFREESTQSAFLGDGAREWDPDEIVESAKFLHFSDWPLPKPWIEASMEDIEKSQSPCLRSIATNISRDCRDRELWLGFYDDFKRRREKICGSDSGF